MTSEGSIRPRRRWSSRSATIRRSRSRCDDKNSPQSARSTPVFETRARWPRSPLSPVASVVPIKNETARRGPFGTEIVRSSLSNGRFGLYGDTDFERYLGRRASRRSFATPVQDPQGHFREYWQFA